MLPIKTDVEIRAGDVMDAPWLLGLFDEAVAWLVARGQTGQWGDQPYSARPAGVGQVQRFAASGGLRIAGLSGTAVGALVLGAAPDYVPSPDRAELYVLLLLTSRRHAGRGIGTRLVEHAVTEARQRGCRQLRVDCWAGAPSLVAWYERHGFERSETFEVKGWRGQLFTMPIGYSYGGASVK